MKKYGLMAVALVVLIGIAVPPASATWTLVGNTVDMSSGRYKQGGEGKYDREALLGSDGALNGTGSDTNVLVETYAFQDQVRMQNSSFGRHNSIVMAPGLGSGADKASWLIQKLTGTEFPTLYVLWGTIVHGTNQNGLSEAWNYTRQPDGTIRVQADLGVSFPGPDRERGVGAWYSTDWDGVTVNADDEPGGTWTQIISFIDFPDAWHKPFMGFTQPPGIHDDYEKDYNGEGTNGTGQGQHPGQGYGGLAQFQTVGGWDPILGRVDRGIDVYVRGAHGAIYYERRPTFGTIVPEPGTLAALLGGVGVFAAGLIRRKKA